MNALWIAALVTFPGMVGDPQEFPLWPEGAPEARGAAPEDIPTCTVHRAGWKPTGAAMIVCPGGGYRALMMTYEGHDIAHWLAARGITAIVLKYRVHPYPPAVSIADGKRAVRVARAHAREWGINPRRIGMIGFSAGGHLASSVGASFDAGDPNAPDPIERQSCRPDFLVLVYPSTTIGGGKPTEEQVTRRTPPAFVVHSARDQIVPVEESRRFVAALRANGVAVEYLELPEGAHGLGCGKGALWERWQEACVEWLTKRKLARPSPSGSQT